MQRNRLSLFALGISQGRVYVEGQMFLQGFDPLTNQRAPFGIFLLQSLTCFSEISLRSKGFGQNRVLTVFWECSEKIDKKALPLC